MPGAEILGFALIFFMYFFIIFQLLTIYYLHDYFADIKRSNKKIIKATIFFVISLGLLALYIFEMEFVKSSIAVYTILFLYSFIVKIIPMRRRFIKYNNLLNTLTLKGDEYNEYIARLLLKCGYKTVRLKQTNKDKVKDIIIIDEDKYILVQSLKSFVQINENKIVAANLIKEQYDISDVWIITDDYYTEQAKIIAKSLNVKLIDRDGLKIMMNLNTVNFISPEEKNVLIRY